MKNRFLLNRIPIILLIFLTPYIAFSMPPNTSKLSDIHIRKGVWNLGDSPREYKFRDIAEDAGFITSFPWEAIRAELSKEVMDSVDIEYWIYTSIEDAELSMVERLDMSNLYMKNSIDFLLPGGQIGDNCWHQIEGGVILFIRNNVWVSIKPPNFGDPFEWSDIELVARKIDIAIVNARKVFRVVLVPAPVIHSVDTISPLPTDWGQSVKVKVNATDPKSHKLAFREVGAGLALINNNGIFTITPDKSIPVFVSKNPNKFKIMIWVWNEEHFVSLVKKEIPF